MSNAILKELGIRDTPAVLRVYLAVLCVLAALAVFAVVQSPHEPTAGVDYDKLAAMKLLTVSVDLIKVVIGAVLGSLTLAAQREFGKTKPADKKKVSENKSVSDAS